MSYADEINAQATKALEGLALPALVNSSAGIYESFENAKKANLVKLRQYLTGVGSPSYNTSTVCAVQTKPDEELDKDQWEIRERKHAPHEIDEARIVWIRYTHGGPHLQAAYYFEWDGE